MEIIGIDHVVLRCRDLERMERFYIDVLGCTVSRRNEALGLIHLRAGNGLIDLAAVNGELGRRGGAGPDRSAVGRRRQSLMDGEILLGGFCVIWLLLGGAMFLARMAGGMRRLEIVKQSKSVEAKAMQLIEEQIEGKKGVVVDLEEQASGRAEDLTTIQARHEAMSRKASPVITVAGREAPKPTEALWTAPFTDPSRPAIAGPRFIGAWAEDGTHARAKIQAALGHVDEVTIGPFGLVHDIQRDLMH